jgi:hypothetical protein
MVEAGEGGGKHYSACKWPETGARRGRAQGHRRAAQSALGGEGVCASGEGIAAPIKRSAGRSIREGQGEDDRAASVRRRAGRTYSSAAFDGLGTRAAWGRSDLGERASSGMCARPSR